MPVNFQEIQSQVHDFGDKAAKRQTRLGNLRQHMHALLKEFAGQQDVLREKVRRALIYNPGLRCAVPTQEILNASFPTPELPPDVTILAADGSQITPSRHDQVEFCVINVGVMRAHLGAGVSPSSLIKSRLLEVEELFTSEGLITEAKVALMRDLSERQVLVDLAQAEPAPVITMTDGPLELYFERRETEDYRNLLNHYLEVLARLARVGASTAGYVDKPEGELVGRLLEVASLPDEELRQAGKKRPFQGVIDESLFQEILKEPGERSALFSIQSLSAQKFRGELSLHFFYLNVGRPGHPHLARVEVPAWVAQDRKLLDTLHSALVAQSQILSLRPYPYILHRAHEVAVVTMMEKEQVEQMIVAEYLRRGMDPGEKSNKQSLKDLPGRKGH